MSDYTAIVAELPQCNFCEEQGYEVTARYDAKTVQGPWAYMCGAHFIVFGTGLGLGIGQRLILKGEE